MRTILVVALLVCTGCPDKTKKTSNPRTTNACEKTIVQVTEATIAPDVAMFAMPAQLAAVLPRANCTGLLGQLRAPQGPWAAIDDTRAGALDAAFAAGKARGIKIGDREATIVTLADRIGVFWPRDPGQPMSGGAVSTGVPASEPDIERFVAGLRGQPNVCAPCEPGGTHPDCDTTPPTGPRGGGRMYFQTEECTQSQCDELVPIYCPATDGGTTTSDAGYGDCECAADCCSSR